MAIVTSTRFSHSVSRVTVGTLSAVAGMFFAFSVANAELPDAEISPDPNQQALDQIESDDAVVEADERVKSQQGTLELAHIGANVFGEKERCVVG